MCIRDSAHVRGCIYARCKVGPRASPNCSCARGAHLRDTSGARCAHMLRLARPAAAGQSSMGHIRCYRPQWTRLAFDIVLRLVPVVVVFDGARAPRHAILVPEVVLRRVHLSGRQPKGWQSTAVLLRRRQGGARTTATTPATSGNQGSWPSRKFWQAAGRGGNALLLASRAKVAGSSVACVHTPLGRLCVPRTS